MQLIQRSVKAKKLDLVSGIKKAATVHVISEISNIYEGKSVLQLAIVQLKEYFHFE